MILTRVVEWTVFCCLVYLGLVYGAYALMLIASALEHRVLSQDEETEDYDSLAESRFTIPVSIIAPAYNEAPVIRRSIQSLLALEYPEFEVVVVNDGSTDATLPLLQQIFDLEKREVFYRRQFDSKRIRGVYRSRTHPRLVVIDKENGGKADALNAGLNLSRYRYICTVDSDTVYAPNALLHSMRGPVRDPAVVVGTTSSVTISGQPEFGDRARMDPRPFANFQRLDYLRSFINNRLGWAHWDFMLCTIGVFAIWRRDVVVELGGFSGLFTCEDIEFTFRVHERFRREGRRFRVEALQESVGWTEGPESIRALISQRARWQRVITETVWHYRRMLLNPRYGSVGLLGMPYYLLVEVLAPVFETAAVLTAPLAWWLGLVTVRDMLLVLLVTAFVNGVFTNFAILMSERSGPAYPTRDLIRLMVLGLGDIFFYRPFLVYARAKGLLGFLMGDKSWDKFERNRRALPVT